VLQLSALKNEGVDRFWQAVTQFRSLQEANGRLAARRRHQSLDWMWERIESGLRQAFRHNAEVKALLPAMTREVEEGRLAASTAARQLLQAMQRTN
jgi:LAO/AO transport system kinase